jgi:hypothetical protein
MTSVQVIVMGREVAKAREEETRKNYDIIKRLVAAGGCTRLNTDKSATRQFSSI